MTLGYIHKHICHIREDIGHIEDIYYFGDIGAADGMHYRQGTFWL